MRKDAWLACIKLAMFVTAIMTAFADYRLAFRNMQAAIGADHHLLVSGRMLFRFFGVSPSSAPKQPVGRKEN